MSLILFQPVAFANHAVDFNPTTWFYSNQLVLLIKPLILFRLVDFISMFTFANQALDFIPTSLRLLITFLILF
jgi:hypothetical protein